MKLATLLLAGLLVVTLAPLHAQEGNLPAGIDKLAATAEESVDVTLDGPLLQLAAKFLAGHDPHEAAVKRIVAGLQGIYVRSFEFDTAGAYNKSDVDGFRAQFKSPEWSRIVSVKSHRYEDADIFLKSTANGQVGGLCIISAEPRELTIVRIVGAIDPSDIADLDGEFGIPHIHHRDRDWR
jgi:hypothetical protein